MRIIIVFNTSHIKKGRTFNIPPSTLKEPAIFYQVNKNNGSLMTML